MCSYCNYIVSVASMDLVISYLLFVTITVPSVVCAQEGTCKACNCRFDNLKVLDELIESRIESKLATQINEQGKNIYSLLIIAYEI